MNSTKIIIIHLKVSDMIMFEPQVVLSDGQNYQTPMIFYLKPKVPYLVFLYGVFTGN